MHSVLLNEAISKSTYLPLSREGQRRKVKLKVKTLSLDVFVAELSLRASFFQDKTDLFKMIISLSYAKL